MVMKKVLYALTLALVIFCVTSCEKEVKDYDGREGVYFYVQYGAEWGDTTIWANQSYTPVEFMNVSGDHYDVKLRVMTTGNIKDYDRTFKVTVDKDSTTAVEGVDYEPFDEFQVVKAGYHYADFMIRLKRNEGIQTEERALVLKLEPTDDFEIGINWWGDVPGLWASDGGNDFDASMHKITMNDFLVRPARWIPAIDYAPGEAEGGLWGAFTRRKYDLICEKFNLTYDDFESEETMPNAKRTMIKDYFVNYLQELYDKGEPVLEEDGRAMWFRGVSWTSIVGQPWVPAE